jgi:hypothetical protein
MDIARRLQRIRAREQLDRYLETWKATADIDCFGVIASN